MTAMTRRVFLLGGVATFPYLYLERISVAVRRYRVQIANLPPSFAGFTILHISDLHEREYGPNQQELLGLIGRERFDAVAITGDMVRGNHPILTQALDVVTGMKKIAPERPIYFVSGNHDWRLERGKEFEGMMQDAGVRVLSNRSEPLERGQDRIWMVGVDDPVTGRDRLSLALAHAEQRAPKLLLSHSPHPFKKAVAKGVDLMMCGHTHGGQVRLPLLGASYVPEMGFFPRYDYGLYRLGNSTLIVSGGLGESGVSIRFNIRPEVSLITVAGSQAPRSVSVDESG
jgi:uncharacterized protein